MNWECGRVGVGGEGWGRRELWEGGGRPYHSLSFSNTTVIIIPPPLSLELYYPPPSPSHTPPLSSISYHSPTFYFLLFPSYISNPSIPLLSLSFPYFLPLFPSPPSPFLIFNSLLPLSLPPPLLLFPHPIPFPFSYSLNHPLFPQRLSLPLSPLSLTPIPLSPCHSPPLFQPPTLSPSPSNPLPLPFNPYPFPWPGDDGSSQCV